MATECYNDGFATQLGVIALLDQSVKRVHVDMDDFSHYLLATTIPDRENVTAYRADVPI
jgi:hypothetical protein